MLTKAALEAEGTPVVLLFDDLNTHTPSLAWARSAATQYLGKHRPQSNVVILTTSGMLRKQATADAAALEEAVAALTSRSEQILMLARAQARLRRAPRLCSRRVGGPWPQPDAAPRWGRAYIFPRGRAAVPNFAALRVDFAHGAKRRDPREPRTASVLTRLTERMHGGGSNVDH